jgi:hypothetical protein
MKLTIEKKRKKGGQTGDQLASLADKNQHSSWATTTLSHHEQNVRPRHFLHACSMTMKQFHGALIKTVCS